jgi:hypothetical protein
MRRDAAVLPERNQRVQATLPSPDPQLEHIELPGSVIYVETTFDGLAAVAIVNLGHHGIVTAHPAQA